MKPKDIYIILFLLACALSLSLVALGIRYKNIIGYYFFDTWTGKQFNAESSQPKPHTNFLDKLPEPKPQPQIKPFHEFPEPKPQPNTKRLIDNFPKTKP